MGHNEVDVLNLDQQNSLLQGDIIPSDEDLLAGGTEVDLEINSGSTEEGSTVESRNAGGAMKPSSPAEAAAWAVTSVQPPEQTRDGFVPQRRFLPRLVIWAIWLLGVAIVLHVCSLAVMGRSMGAAGLWEVFSLLVVVLVQEVLQFLGFGSPRPPQRELERAAFVAAAADDSITAIEREVAVHAKGFDGPDISGTTEKKEELNIENSEFLCVNPPAVAPVAKTLETTPGGDVLETSPAVKPSAPEDEEPSEAQQKPSSGGLPPDGVKGDAGSGCGTTAWGMDVGAFITDHPTTPKVPVWDLYASSESNPPPSNIVNLPDASNPTIVVTPPAQAPSTEN